MAHLCLWSKIHTKQWLVLGASAFQCMRAGFLCPKCDNFAFLHTRQDQSELHLKRWFFFLPKPTSSVSRSRSCKQVQCNTDSRYRVLPKVFFFPIEFRFSFNRISSKRGPMLFCTTIFLYSISLQYWQSVISSVTQAYLATQNGKVLLLWSSSAYNRVAMQ